MKKVFLFLFILLLAGLVLIGGGCGDTNGKKEVNLENINLEKKLSSSDIENVLLKSAKDLGWSGADANEITEIRFQIDYNNQTQGLVLTETSKTTDYVQEYCSNLTKKYSGLNRSNRPNYTVIRI